MTRLTFNMVNPITGEKQYFPDSVYKKDGETIVDFKMQSRCNNKLGELEDIEQKLRIDLITLFKALREGIWVKSPEINKIKVVLEYDQDEGFVFTNYNESWGYNVPEYKNTWALKKEELE